MFPPGPEFLFRVCCGLTADDGDGEAVTMRMGRTETAR